MVAPPPGVHGSPINPLVGCTATKDDRYISFVMMQPTKFWADVCRHIDLDELVDDPRFATVESIAENTAEAVGDPARGDRHPYRCPSGASGSRPWPGRGRRCRTPCRRPRTRRSGPTSTSCRRASSNWWPIRCSSTSPHRIPGPAPAFAEQTDEILQELGLDWDRIIELKTAGAVT